MNSELLRHLVAGATLVSLSGCADFERGDRTAIDGAAAPVEAGVADGGAAADSGGPRVSYSTTVYPLLLAGCRDCHRAGGEAANTQLILSGDAALDHGAVSALVNPAQASQSRLLLKSSGQGHQGGAVYPVNSPSYQWLLQWIEQGARP